MKSEAKNSDSSKPAAIAAPQTTGTASNNVRVKRQSDGSTPDGLPQSQNDGDFDDIVFEAKDNDWYEEHKKKENMFKLFRQKVETGAKEAEIASTSQKVYPKPQFKYSKEELFALSQIPRSLIRPSDLAPLYCKNEPGNLTEIKNEKIERSMERNAEKAAFERHTNPDSKALTRSEDRTHPEKGRQTGEKVERPNPEKAKKGSWVKTGNDKVPPLVKKDKKDEPTPAKEKKPDDTADVANTETVTAKPLSARGEPVLAPENIVLGPPRKIFPSSQVSSKNPRVGLSQSTTSITNSPLSRNNANSQSHHTSQYSNSGRNSGGSSRPNPRSNFHRSASVSNNITSPSSSPVLQSSNYGMEMGSNPKAPLYRSSSVSNDIAQQPSAIMHSASAYEPSRPHLQRPKHIDQSSEGRDGLSKAEQPADLVNSVFSAYKKVNLEEFLNPEAKANDTSGFPAVRSKALSCWFDDQKQSTQPDPEDDSKLEDDEDLKDFEYLRRDYEMGDSNDDLVAFPGQSLDGAKTASELTNPFSQHSQTANPKSSEWGTDGQGQFDFKNWLSSLSAPDASLPSQPKPAAPFSGWGQPAPSHYNADLMKNNVNIHGIPSVHTKHSLPGNIIKTSESSPFIKNIPTSSDHMVINDKGNRNGLPTNIGNFFDNFSSVTTPSSSSIAPSFSSPSIKGNYPAGNANGIANMDNVNKHVNKSGGHSTNFGMNIPGSSFDKSNNQQPQTVLNLLASLQTPLSESEQDKSKSQRKESREKIKQGPEKQKDDHQDVNKAFNSKNVPNYGHPAQFFMGNYHNPYGNPQFNEAPFAGHSFTGMHGQEGLHNAQSMGPHGNFHGGGYPPYFNMHNNFMNMGMAYDAKGNLHQQPMNLPLMPGQQPNLGNNNHGGAPAPHAHGHMHFGQQAGGLEKWFGNISQVPQVHQQHQHQQASPANPPLPRNAKIMFLDEIENKMK